jgi:hypothetical protein
MRAISSRNGRGGENKLPSVMKSRPFSPCPVTLLSHHFSEKSTTYEVGVTYMDGCYYYGVRTHGDPCTATISHLLCVPTLFLIIVIRLPDLSGSYQQMHLVAKQEKLGEKLPLNFAYEVYISYL